ncbi:hypothetical protein PUN28_020226 [Cardiocondyla obscurior]|uniref:Secreted protein n=1 Tax=Cardiocondyla obscurior TaxID=286306 RepID=A0AAW2E9T1_9HYME
MRSVKRLFWPYLTYVGAVGLYSYDYDYRAIHLAFAAVTAASICDMRRSHTKRMVHVHGTPAVEEILENALHYFCPRLQWQRRREQTPYLPFNKSTLLIITQ